MDERKFFDTPAVSSVERDEVLNHYKVTLGRITRLLKRHDVPLLLSTLAGNFADWEPNRSVYRGKIQDKLKFKSLMDLGASFEKSHDFHKAITQYQSAILIDAGFSNVVFDYHAGGIGGKGNEGDFGGVMNFADGDDVGHGVLAETGSEAGDVGVGLGAAAESVGEIDGGELVKAVALDVRAGLVVMLGAVG